MDRKKIILTVITFVLFIIVFVLSCLLFNKYVLKKAFEDEVISFANKNEKTIFKVNKIVFFSSCDVKNKTSSATNFTIEDLFQYTDFAIFINTSNDDEKNAENTFKKVFINNIKFNNSPQLR